MSSVGHALAPMNESTLILSASALAIVFRLGMMLHPSKTDLHYDVCGKL